MTKAEYIDFIRNSLPMVDKTSRFHYEQVAAAINLAVNSVYWQMYSSADKKMKKSLDRYTTLTANLNPTLDTVLDGDSVHRYELILTSDIVDLPRKTGGIMEIIQWDGVGLTANPELSTLFVPVSTMEGEQLYGSESSLPGNVVGFSWSGDRRIEFWGLSAVRAAEGVNVRYIKQFRSYASTDRILLPFGQEQAIIDKVREYLGATPPKDLVNDNADSNG
jgi:hypothetical protein